MKLLLALGVFLLGKGATANVNSLTAALTKAVLDDYEPRSPPDGLVELKVGMDVLGLGLCPTKQELSVDAWMKTTWTDNRLTWNATEWGISSLKIPVTEIWQPDAALFNAVDKVTLFQPSRINNAVIFPTGMVIFVPVLSFKSLCQVDFDNYPFGTQDCSVKIGSWTSDTSQIDIAPYHDSNSKSAINFEYMPTNMIEIESSSVKEVSKVYPCCPETYKHLVFNIVFRQKATYHHGKLHTPDSP